MLFGISLTGRRASFSSSGVESHGKTFWNAATASGLHSFNDMFCGINMSSDECEAHVLNFLECKKEAERDDEDIEHLRSVLDRYCCGDKQAVEEVELFGSTVHLMEKTRHLMKKYPGSCNAVAELFEECKEEHGCYYALEIYCWVLSQYGDDATKGKMCIQLWGESYSLRVFSRYFVPIWSRAKKSMGVIMVSRSTVGFYPNKATTQRKERKSCKRWRM